MKSKTFVLILGFLMVGCSPSHSEKKTKDLPIASHAITDAYDGWRVGMQLWTFNRYTFYEALEKTADLGVTWVQAYPGQKLSEDDPDLKFDHTLPAEKRQEVKQVLKSKGLRLVNYGVVGLSTDEAENRKVFEFAKDMGIELIITEPKDESAWDVIEKLCEEYDMRAAMHNHPKPSHYWNPELALKISQAHGIRIGVCADIGHWMRSGVQPIDALKMLEGRIFDFHFGDLNEFGVREAHDVPWGTGVANVKAIMQEMHRQKYQGTVSVEFEYNWEASVPEVRQSLRYFDEVARSINPSGWQNLFAEDLSNAIVKPGTWEWQDDGTLALLGGGYIWTKEDYGNYILDLEFKLSPDANSGVFLRAGDLDNYVHSSIEVQIHESTDGSKYGSCGSIYDCLGPKADVVKKAGEWNRYTITCLDNKIYVVQNGVQIIDMDLNLWTEAGKNPDGTENKFKTAYKDMPRVGKIGLQDHGNPLWFRNLRIKKL
ncbi:MAG: DUF1080 domain-containing protein [Calditrichaeota bacterium]|nr:MAG: DUF1080 domain-containing protein [Calditrichota bacterium]